MFGKKKKDKQTIRTGIIFNDVSHFSFDDSSKWDSFTPERKKKATTIFVASIILTLACIVYLSFADEVHTFFNSLGQGIPRPVVRFLVVHFPSLIDTVLCIFGFMFIFYILKYIHCHITFRSQKSKTLVGLFFSISYYVLFIICLLLALTGWGVDTYGLLASAGILTLIVGLGAESIVADLIAGIFIAIEGHIAVGDIVYINDFVGTVREIGLRVSIIENLNNHRQIVRNSEINLIVNTSRSACYNKVTFVVQHKSPSELIDRLMNDNLERLKNSYPDIKSVHYLGLYDFTHFGATYCVAFVAPQKRSIQSRAALLQEIYRILEENGVIR